MNELTADILKGAEVNKSQQKKKRTTAQLPIYRDASNLLYIIMRVMCHAPRKMTKALDEAIVCGTELCRSLALANEVRGFLVQGNEYRKRTEIFKMLPYAWYIYFNITNRRKVTIKRRYRYDKCN